MKQQLLTALAAIIPALYPANSQASEPSAVANVGSGWKGPEFLSPYAGWKNGLSTNEDYFPIAVWLQSPRNAARFKAAGVNLYVGLWQGPTTEQLAQLNQAGMAVVCGQNRVGLENKENPIIVAWMHGDEPDNAQGLPGLRRYGPPIPTERIVRDYERIHSADPTRPVLLNLGQGVAWDNYIGRGVRRNHPEDYPEYLKGCDIASFDIYPVVHDSPEIAGKLEFVAKGVRRLVQWTHGQKPVWNCIECTHISNPDAKATPDQVRSEVWMSLIHGSRGLIYFVHQFKPVFKEAALLDDPELLPAVTGLNQQIHRLAPVLNSPTRVGGLKVSLNGSSVPSMVENSGPVSTLPLDFRPLAWIEKRYKGALYLFAVNMRKEPAHAAFTLSRLPADRAVEVLDEQRRIPIQDGTFADDFKGYEVHLYAVQGGL